MYKIDYFIVYYQTQQATNKQNIRKQKNGSTSRTSQRSYSHLE
jgi:hypothetical protein